MGPLFALLICFSLLSTALGTSYYFAANGNDNAATSSPSTPWQSITKVNSLTLKAGDSVLFNKGDTFRGQITFLKSGTATSPIVFSSYGSASNLPTIKGSIVVSSGWTLYSGNIYKATVSSTVTEVFVNGAIMTLARYPNSGFLRVKSMTGWKLTSANLTQANSYWNGATIKLRTTNWSYDQSPISAYTSSSSGGQLTLSNHNIEDIDSVQGTPGWGFYLENKLSILDAPGEWFYDTSSHTLYLWMPTSANPNGANVEATVYNYGIYDNGQSSYFQVQNLRFSQQEIVGVYIYGGSNNVINNCQFTSQGQHGVYLDSATNPTVSNSQFTNIYSHAITFDTVTTGTISNNVVSSIGLIDGKGIPGTGGIAGISVQGGSKVAVLNNRVTQIGYIGIRFDGGHHHIEGNVVDWCMLTLDDGGGIYCYDDVSTGSLIKNNIVSNIYPNVLSTPDWSSPGEAHCLYFDSFTTGQTVLNNTFYNCLTSGLYIHDSPNNIVRYNVLYNSSAQISFFDQSFQGATYNNTIDHNYLLAAQPSQVLVDEYTLFGDTDIYATYSNNQYAAPYNDFPFNAKTEDEDETSYSFSDWVDLKNTHGDILSPFTDFPAQTVIGYYGNNLVSSTATYDCWCQLDGCTITSISSSSCSYPNSTVSSCHSVNAPNGAGSNDALQAITPSFSLLATYNGQPAVYEISLVAFASVQHSFFSVAAMNHDPYSDLSGEFSVLLQANQPQKIVRYFTPYQADSVSCLVIQSSADLSKLSFSQVSVRLANVQGANYQTRTGIIVNPTNTAVSAGPLRSGVPHYNLLGSQITFPVSIPPYSSILVVFTE